MLAGEIVENYRVSRTYFTFLNWLKMAVRNVLHKKKRLYYYHKDPPFDMIPYLMSADPIYDVKIAQKSIS